MFSRDAEGHKTDEHLHDNPEGERRAADLAVQQAVESGMSLASAKALFGYVEPKKSGKNKENSGDVK